MMTLQYKTLRSIAFKHAYYRDEISRDFTLVPTVTSLELMEKFGLLAKTVKGKTSILQKMDGNMADTPIDKPICLSFAILLDNPLLLNLTETFETRRFYLTNLASDGTLRTRLTEQAHLSPSEALAKLSPQRFSLDFPKGQFQELAIERILPTVIAQNLPPLSINAAMENIEVNLKESGLYKLTKKPIGVSETVYAHDEIRASPSFFGILDLFLDNTVVNYTVELKQRVFKLQYFLVDIINQGFNITDPSNISLSFTKNLNDSVTPTGIIFSYQDQFTMSADALKMITDIKKNNPYTIKDIYLFESSTTNIPILEHRPPTVTMDVITNPQRQPQLPVPDIENLQIRLPTPTDVNAMIFYNI